MLPRAIAKSHKLRPMDDVTFSDNTDQHRFELHKDGVVAAYSEYNLLTGSVLFTHTEVLPQYEGQGIGSKLAKYALDEVRKRGLNVIPACPFVASYIHRHADYQDLVTEQNRKAFKA